MHTITRRSVLKAAALGGALAAPSVLRPAAAQQAINLAIATGTTGGVYYPLGGGMANLFSRTIPGMSATVETTGGSVANNQLLGAGRVGMILTQVDAAVDAVRGSRPHRGPQPIRAILVMYTNRMQVVTVEGRGIEKFEDLKGKRVSTGAPGSATEVFAFRLLEAAGIDRDKDFRARERLSPAESQNAIKDGKLDAFFFVSGVPTSAIVDLGASPGVRLKMVDHDQYAAALTQKFGPIYFPEVIPANTYPGQSTDNKQMSVGNIIAVRTDAQADLVQKLLAAIWDHLPDLHRVHREAMNFKLENQTKARAGIPWHPAAEAFYKARGVNMG